MSTEKNSASPAPTYFDNEVWERAAHGPSHPRGPGWLRVIRRSLADFIAHRALKAAEAKLQALDDRALKDIGIDRSEIGSVLMNLRQERRSGMRLRPQAHGAGGVA